MTHNGLELDLLQGVVETIRDHPEAGRVTMRIRHRWDDGFAVDAHDGEIEEAGEIARRTYTFRTDWPREVGGQDSGPSPGETLLAALGGCVAMTYVTKAAARGVDIGALEVAIEARVDLRGTFELDSVRAGLSDVTVTVGVRTDADDATLDDLGHITRRTSGVYDSLANPVPVRLFVQRLPWPQLTERSPGSRAARR